MRVDPVQLKILENHAQAIAESMAFTLFRTAHSTFVKETEDFTTGLATPDGMTFASPRDLGATWFIGLDYSGAIKMIPDYKPGDICITNDPYSGFVCTHTPDLHIWKPIFWKDEIVAFAVGHIHNTDMGGAVPASLSRSLTEIHQEGVRFRPIKLASEGKLNQALVDIMLNNVRMPEQNWGDLKAQIAAVNTGERDVHEMISRFGVETFKHGIEDLLDLGEQHARNVIRDIPDGDYFFADYLDEDCPGGVPARLALNLQIRGDEAILDLRESDPQLLSSLNVPTGGNERHILLMVGYNYVLYTLDPTMPLNGGVTRPARCLVSEGSILNPQKPAAVGMRSMTSGRLQGLILGAFSAALPDRLPAGPAGGGGIMNVRTYDSRSNRLIMASIDPVTGGAGGSPFGDGADGSGGTSSFLKNTPVEINEVEVPIKFLRYDLVPDSGGPGLYRGGLATEIEVQVFSPDTVVTARNRDRTHFSAWGVAGGVAGGTSYFWKTSLDGVRVDLGNTDVVRLDPGDVFFTTSGGGGGWGDPFARDPAKVAFDLAQGKVTLAAAERDYGVVIIDGRVDERATSALRTRRPARGPEEHFSYNTKRLDYEAVWTKANYAVLGDCLARLPVHWRHFMKRRIFDLVANVPADELTGSGAEVRRAIEQTVAALPQLAPYFKEAAE